MIQGEQCVGESPIHSVRLFPGRIDVIENTNGHRLTFAIRGFVQIGRIESA